MSGKYLPMSLPLSLPSKHVAQLLPTSLIENKLDMNAVLKPITGQIP